MQSKQERVRKTLRSGFQHSISKCHIAHFHSADANKGSGVELSRKARKTIFTVFQYPTIGRQRVRLMQPNAPLEIHFITAAVALHNSPREVRKFPRKKKEWEFFFFLRRNRKYETEEDSCPKGNRGAEK